MSIKYHLTKIAEKLTGRKCTSCGHNVAGRCCHPDGAMFMKCWQSLTRPGFKHSESVHHANTAAAAAAEGIQSGLAAELTPEQQHQLEKIKETLQEAGEIARDGGLVED